MSFVEVSQKGPERNRNAADMSGVPGAFRRLRNKVARWSEALSYSGIDYTPDRMAFIERELAEIKDRSVNSKRHGMSRQMCL
jgi:hypothetical protein